MASKRPAAFTRVGWMLVVAVVLVVGCQRSSSPTIEADVSLQIEPDPPQVGQAEIAVIVTDQGGKPLEGGALKVEGNMNHAGMTPTFANLTETEPGRYEGTLELTMAGDWFLLVTGEFPKGGKLKEKIDLPGVEQP